MSNPDRVRITISLAKEVADRIDETVDGLKIRNRSHAVESLVIESLHISQVKHAVILAGGEHALKRLPAIRGMLKTLVRAGIFEVTVAVGFLGDKIRQELGMGDAYGLRISYHQTELGTGGAIAELKERLKQTFLIINISEPVEVDVRNILKFHREHGPIVTLVSKGLTDLSGIYVVEPKIFATIPPGFCMLEDTVFPELTKQGKLLPYPVLTAASSRQ
jgi:NDP-sugar pyrophosphorylase family protein